MASRTAVTLSTLALRKSISGIPMLEMTFVDEGGKSYAHKAYFSTAAKRLTTSILNVLQLPNNPQELLKVVSEKTFSKEAKIEIVLDDNGSVQWVNKPMDITESELTENLEQFFK